MNLTPAISRWPILRATSTEPPLAHSLATITFAVVPLDIPLFPRNLTWRLASASRSRLWSVVPWSAKAFNGEIGPRDISMSLIDRLLLELARQACC